MRTDQVRERLDSGDVHGAVRLILKTTIGEVKKGIPTQETNSLSALQEKAANEFFARHPEIELQIAADKEAAPRLARNLSIGFSPT